MQVIKVIDALEIKNKSGWNPTQSCDGVVTKGSMLKLVH